MTATAGVGSIELLGSGGAVERVYDLPKEGYLTAIHVDMCGLGWPLTRKSRDSRRAPSGLVGSSRV